MQSARFVLFAIAIASVPSLAHAQEAPFECKPDGNQREMNACAFNDYKTADEKLNATYTEVMATLPAQQRGELRSKQRAWLKRRDAHCYAKAKSVLGGSIWPLEYYSCLQTQTEKRTEEIAHRKNRQK